MRLKYKQRCIELEAEVKAKDQIIEMLMVQKGQMVQNIKQINADKAQLINQLYEKADVDPEDIFNNRFDTDSGMYQISGPGEAR